MKVRITDKELARCIGIGLAVTGKRGQSKDAEVSVLRQLSRYDVFREADSAEVISQSIPLFPDDFGVTRGAELFDEQCAERKAQRRDFNWPLKIEREG